MNPSRPSVVGSSLLAGGLLAAVFLADQAPGGYRKTAMIIGVMALAGIAAFDARTRRAPNRIVYPLAAVATLAPFGLGLSTGLDALAGGALAFGLLLVAVLVGRGAMGYGDAKVGYVCGALVGLGGVLPMLLGTFILGGAFAGVALGLRIRKRKDTVAFTPFLFAGVLLALFLVDGSVYIPSG